jgi:hypothetical protein
MERGQSRLRRKSLPLNREESGLFTRQGTLTAVPLSVPAMSPFCNVGEPDASPLDQKNHGIRSHVAKPPSHMDGGKSRARPL